jgi:hypothetical protein
METTSKEMPRGSRPPAENFSSGTSASREQKNSSAIASHFHFRIHSLDALVIPAGFLSPSPVLTNSSVTCTTHFFVPLISFLLRNATLPPASLALFSKNRDAYSLPPVTTSLTML